MAVTKSIITCGFLPRLVIEPSLRSQTRISLHSSSIYAKFNNQDRSLLWRDDKRGKSNEKSTRRFLVCAVQPGVPPPSEPPFNVINWIVGVALTVVLPFFSHKWASLIKLKNEVETAVEAAEEIVEAVEKAAEGVEKFAEDIIDDLPEGGRLRKAVEFVEHVAERAAKDAHTVDDFIDKVQEVEEKVEDYVESFAEEAITHHHHKEEEEHPKEENNEEEVKEEEENNKEEVKEEEENNDADRHKQ